MANVASATSLLPINATPQEVALEQACSRISSVPVPLRDLWNPNTCPSAMLPWLAWSLGVDQWDPTWTDAVKRQVIAASYSQHQIRGTIASIRAAMASLGFGNITIDEGRGGKFYNGALKYDGFAVYGDPSQWAVYRIRFQKLLSVAQAAMATALLEDCAPARCHLYGFDFTAAALPYNGMAKYDGSYTYGGVV